MVRAASGDRKLAVSVTHSEGVSGIGVSTPYRIAAQTRTRGQEWRRRKSKLEVHLWRPFGSGFCQEVRLGCEFVAEETCDHHHRETVARSIEGLRCFVESLPLDSDAILCAFELRLQVAEIGGRFELWIVFGDG